MDPRLKASIETFSIGILQEDYSIMLYGFFKIDRGLFHKVSN